MLYQIKRQPVIFAFFMSVFLQLDTLHCQELATFQIHSHNDYEQKIPFWNAYGNGLNSIEIDVFLVNDTLYVAHHKSEIKKERTIESLYLDPLQKMIDLKLGDQQALQILIDVKTDAEATLSQLINVLKQYPALISSPKISFVISGNRPNPEAYQSYPDFILFDYQSMENLQPAAWKKVALISLSFSKYSKWNGIDPLSPNDLDVISKIIHQAHAYQKPFRFWGTPDTEFAWNTFVKLGIDFINTDKPYECSRYLNGTSVSPK